MRQSQYEPRSYYDFSTRLGVRSTVPWLIIACVAVFLLQRLAGGKEPTISRVLGEMALHPMPILSWRLWQYFTYMFLHAGGWHLFINMLYLYWFGREMETILGPRRFLTFYLTAGFVAGVAHKLFAVAGRLPNPVVGASGGILALLVAFALYFPDSLILVLFIFPMKMKHFVLLLVSLNLYFAVTFAQNDIASVAHLGGAAYGFVYVKYGAGLRLALANGFDLFRFLGRATRARRRSRLQAIRDKARAHGLDGLKPGEIKFLRKMSRKPRKEEKK